MKRKVGKPKVYNCAIKTITISVPVDAIPAIKILVDKEKKKHLL
jgi:hypothetical protein